jgi:peptidoglycan-N-acetylglucosamine deacetylase
MPIGSALRRGLLVAATVALLAGATPVLGAAADRSTSSDNDTAADDDTAAVRDLALERRTRCGRGLVALTFDDGPAPRMTRRMMQVLTRRDVPATFFLVGQRIPGHGRLLRRMHRLGFRAANHTYRHQNLTRLSNHRVRATLRHVNRAIHRTGLPRPRLMRPPYGAIDPRVRRIVHDMGMTPVLWNVDSRDWDGRPARRIVARVLGHLHPGRNTVLLHDGVANSNQTLAALPRLIRSIRRHGYCLTRLNRRGVPTPPVPKVRVSGDRVREKGRRHPTYLRFDVRLSKPTSRPVSVKVRTRKGSATPGRDYQAREFRLRFPVGTTHRVVRVKVLGNRRAERTERLRVRLSRPHHVRLGDRVAPGRIRDDDRRPPRQR